MSLLLCIVTDVSAGLCLSPLIKSCGFWLRSTGKVQTASDVCCSLKWRNDLMAGRGAGVMQGHGWEDVMDRIKSKHPTELALLNNGSSLLTSSAATGAWLLGHHVREKFQKNRRWRCIVFFLNPSIYRYRSTFHIHNNLNLPFKFYKPRSKRPGVNIYPSYEKL